jgi:hypothetical protein
MDGKDKYRVVLLNLVDNDTPEMMFETADRCEALEWVREWLIEPLGLTVGIIPPMLTTK